MRGPISPHVRLQAKEDTKWLLPQLWCLTFLPRRGRCIVSLSCDRAVPFCYPHNCQMTRPGCKKAPSLPLLHCLAHCIWAGRGPASPCLCVREEEGVIEVAWLDPSISAAQGHLFPSQQCHHAASSASPAQLPFAGAFS